MAASISATSFFDAFPLDITHHIFSYLPLRELLQLSQVCKKLNSLLSNDNLWKLSLDPFLFSVDLTNQNQFKAYHSDRTFKNWKNYCIEQAQINKFYQNITASHFKHANTFYQNKKGIIKEEIDGTITLETRARMTYTLPDYPSFPIFLNYQHSFVISAHQDGALQIWDSKKDLSFFHNSFQSIDNLDCKDTTIVVREGMEIYVLDCANHYITITNQWTINDSAVTTIKLVDDSQLLTSHLNGEIKIWDIKTEKLIKIYQAPNTINCTESNFFRIVGGAEDQIIYIWDKQTSKLLYTLEGHHHPISCLYLQEHLLISGDQKGVIKIWDCNSGICLNTLKQHQSRIDFLWIDPIFNQLISHSKEEAKTYYWSFNLNNKTNQLIQNISAFFFKFFPKIGSIK